jgi:hypothetical protein
MIFFFFTYKKKIICKLDIQMAYNHVNWDGLSYSFVRFGSTYYGYGDPQLDAYESFRG